MERTFSVFVVDVLGSRCVLWKDAIIEVVVVVVVVVIVVVVTPREKVPNRATSSVGHLHVRKAMDL